MTRKDIVEDWQKVGSIIDDFNDLEYKVNKVISCYLKSDPSTEDFFRIIVLDNSIISFGSKIKLIQAICKSIRFSGLKVDDLQQVTSLRNAFAHNRLAPKFRKAEFLRFLDRSSPDQDVRKVNYGRYFYYVLESVKGNGTIRAIGRDEAFRKYHELSNKVKVVLDKILEKVGG